MHSLIILRFSKTVSAFNIKNKFPDPDILSDEEVSFPAIVDFILESRIPLSSLILVKTGISSSTTTILLVVVVPSGSSNAYA